MSFQYGYLTGTIRAVVGNEPGDPFPDIVHLPGLKAEVEPTPPRLTDSAAKITYFTAPIALGFDNAGVLRLLRHIDDNGDPTPDAVSEIPLIAQDDDDLNPQGGWTYQITVTAPGISTWSFPFQVNTGEVHDLSEIATAAQSPGVITTRGPRGYNAFELAVQQGYTGSLEDWLDEETAAGNSAADAAQSASDAAGSASSAAADAASAAGAAGAAQGSAAAAAGSATTAEGHASAAAGSASSAAGSAGAAALSAGTSSTKADEAAGSAQSASDDRDAVEAWLDTLSLTGTTQGSVAPGSPPVVQVTKTAPGVYELRVDPEKGDKGDPPALEAGSVTKVAPGGQPTLDVVETGPGAYRLDAGLVTGDTGAASMARGVATDLDALFGGVNAGAWTYLTGTNGAPTINGGQVVVAASTASTATTQWLLDGDSSAWVRRYNTATWSPWRRLDLHETTASELRGTGSPLGVVAAPPGTYYTDTLGSFGAWRWLKTSTAGTSGWRVIHGDTGWRSLLEVSNGEATSGTIPAGFSVANDLGRAYIRSRTTADACYYQVMGLQYVGGAGHLPQGFESATPGIYTFPANTATAAEIKSLRFTMQSTGVPAVAMSSGDMFGQSNVQTPVTIVMPPPNSWPATLLGTPA